MVTNAESRKVSDKRLAHLATPQHGGTVWGRCCLKFRRCRSLTAASSSCNGFADGAWTARRPHRQPWRARRFVVWGAAALGGRKNWHPKFPCSVTCVCVPPHQPRQDGQRQTDRGLFRAAPLASCLARKPERAPTTRAMASARKAAHRVDPRCEHVCASPILRLSTASPSSRGTRWNGHAITPAAFVQAPKTVASAGRLQGEDKRGLSVSPEAGVAGPVDRRHGNEISKPRPNWRKAPRCA